MHFMLIPTEKLVTSIIQHTIYGQTSAAALHKQRQSGNPPWRQGPWKCLEYWEYVMFWAGREVRGHALQSERDLIFWVCYITNGINEKQQTRSPQSVTYRNLPHAALPWKAWHHCGTLYHVYSPSHTDQITHIEFTMRTSDHINTQATALNPGAIGSNWLGGCSAGVRPLEPSPAVFGLTLGTAGTTQRRYLASNRNSWHAQSPHLYK